MSAILDKLLKGQKVEWETIGDLGILNRGKRLVRSQLGETGTYPVYQNSLTPLGYFDDKNTLPNTTFIIAAGAAGEIGHSKSEFWAADDCYFFKVPREKLNDKFIYYFLLTQKSKIVSQVRKASVPRLGRNSVENIAIPIPPLDVQAEIVRILDTFTAVTAELTQELAKEKILREKQYQYYRDKLLSFSDVSIETDSNRQQQTALCEGLANNVKQNHQIIWKSLGEVAEYSKSRISFDKLNEKNYIGVDNLLQNRMGKTNSSYLPNSGNLTAYFENDILIGNIRPYLKKIWQANQIGGTNGDVLVIHLKDKNILPRYLYQILADDKFFDFNMQNAKGAKMPRGNKEAILKYSFPVPPLDEQKRIVNILDKFEALTHSITEGLPKEITLREQQYEYYREQLIDFPKN